MPECKPHFKVGLHYADYRSKLVPFEEQKNIFYFKKTLALSDNRNSVNTTLPMGSLYKLRQCK
jgi:hypothetical protein